MAQVEVVYYVIEYLANYWLVGLLWGVFYVYGTHRPVMALRWPIGL